MTVPCNGCMECCKGPDRGLLVLLDGLHPGIKVERCGAYGFLARKLNGDCLYLGENGCTIYDVRPQECRQFDCREHIGDPFQPIRIVLAGIACKNRG